MRAISVPQPWANLILLGVQRLINHPWSYAKARGTFVLHAHAHRDPALDAYAATVIRHQGIQMPSLDHLPRNVILGTVTIDRCVRPDTVAPDQQPWAIGPWCFLLDDVLEFPTPIPHAVRIPPGILPIPDCFVAAALRRHSEHLARARQIIDSYDLAALGAIAPLALEETS